MYTNENMRTLAAVKIKHDYLKNVVQWLSYPLTSIRYAAVTQRVIINRLFWMITVLHFQMSVSVCIKQHF